MQKTIIITGSSRGIGKAIAELAHKQSYKVIVHGKTDSPELAKTHKELKASIKTFFDISDKNAVQTEIGKLGKIDVLVNNAGVALNFLKDIGDVDDQKALMEYQINVLGTIHCIQAVLPGMIKNKKGSVINISSIKGMSQLATLSTLTFATTKAGIISLTKALAKSYAKDGIRFNVVMPGYVETDQVKLWNEETFKRINEGTLFGRMASPSEIAPLVMFLASDEASYITGSEYLIDGGYILKGK